LIWIKAGESFFDPFCMGRRGRIARGVGMHLRRFSPAPDARAEGRARRWAGMRWCASPCACPPLLIPHCLEDLVQTFLAAVFAVLFVGVLSFFIQEAAGVLFLMGVASLVLAVVLFALSVTRR